MRRTPIIVGGILLLAVGAFLISRRASWSAPDGGANDVSAVPTVPVEAPPATAEDSVLAAVSRPRFGDFDSMRARRIVRVLVSPSQTQYFLDQGTPRGLTVDAASLFEAELNRKYRTGSRLIRVIIIPVQHDELLPALLAGRGDIVASAITITPERKARADFSDPTLRNVSEIVVTGPASPHVVTLDDLAGQEVFVRRSSSYYESLQRLNETFGRRGLAPVRLREAPEALENEDLLEMLNAGLVSLVVIDDFLATFWAQILPDIRPQPGLAVNTGGDIAWMFRKDSPQLKQEVNAFLARYPEGSATRNTLLNRYLKSTRFVRNATNAAELEKFNRLVALFRKYSGQYEMDYLLMMAQGYQESRLDQSARSHVGAVGVMQVMPATGSELGVGDIQEVEPNVHAGVKYIRAIMDRYFAGDSIDALNRTLLAFAAYNAGPARVASLRRKAAARGLDPNRWSHNVELVAADVIGRETVTYVGNIYKYYVAYSLVMEQAAEREAALRRHPRTKVP